MTFLLLLQQDRVALEQSLLCSAMLSERVVLVLSKQYVQETWFIFEKILRQLTQMSLHNQRIMGVLLEDCDIPDTLGELYFLDTSDPDFFDVFVKRLKTGDDEGGETDWVLKGKDEEEVVVVVVVVVDMFDDDDDDGGGGDGGNA